MDNPETEVERAKRLRAENVEQWLPKWPQAMEGQIMMGLPVQLVSDLLVAANKIERLQRERDGERAARKAAMDVLFAHLRQRGIDYSDLLP